MAHESRNGILAIYSFLYFKTDMLESSYWPFAVLGLSVIVVVLLISRFRFHPFIALLLSAIFVGLISPALPDIVNQHPLVTAVELPMQEFGIMAGKIAWVIGRSWE